MNTAISNNRTGLTLVELLVVIAIMGLLTALIVPQVRLVNKDRNIREAARVVGTALTQARDRAISSGAGGLLIERNANLGFPAANPSVFYGGTRLYQLRGVPNLMDDFGRGVRVSDPPVSLQSTEFKMVTFHNRLVPNQFRLGDYVSFSSNSGVYNSNSSRDYLITHIGQPHASEWNNWGTEIDVIVKLDGLALTNTVPGQLPDPTANPPKPEVAPEERSYEIKRQPRKLKNSKIDLPDGYIIDLRYSGPLDEDIPFTGGQDSEPSSTTKFSMTQDLGDIAITFTESGSLDRIGYLTDYDDEWDGPQDAQKLPKKFPVPQYPMCLEAINLFVTEYGPQYTQAGDYNETANKILANPASLWVTLNARTGGVNVGYNAPNITGTAYQDIRNSQLIARKRISANQ